MSWFGSVSDCPSPREVRDFAGDLFERRTRQELVGGFRKRKSEELPVSVGAVKENQRSEATSASVLACFGELKDILPTWVTSNQILKIDETGLSVHPMKGKK
jgi:hypothetical protein